MRPSRFPALLSAVAATALLAAGCGLTDNEVLPGAAAEVEGRTLELSKVDRAVQDYCALRAVNPQASAAPTALIRSQFVVGWTQAVAVEELASDNDVDLPAEAIDRTTVLGTWGDLGEIDDDNYDTFEWLTWIQLRLGDPVLDLGRAQEGSSADEQAAVSAGINLITGWLDDHDVTFNPVFGQYDAATGLFTGDPLSVPVSDAAKTADDTSALTPQQIAELPAEQRCGPATVPADGPQIAPQG